MSTGNSLNYSFPYPSIAPFEIPASHLVEICTVKSSAPAGRTEAWMVSPEIPPDQIRRLGLTPLGTVQEAFSEAARRKGTTARVVILGMGGRSAPLR